MERLDRLEQEYLELFLGRRVVTTETRRFRVTPAEGKLQQIVCRFSPDAGLLPANDLTGDIVLLQYEPQGMAVDEAACVPLPLRFRTVLPLSRAVRSSLPGRSRPRRCCPFSSSAVR